MLFVSLDGANQVIKLPVRLLEFHEVIGKLQQIYQTSKTDNSLLVLSACEELKDRYPGLKHEIEQFKTVNFIFKTKR